MKKFLFVVLLASSTFALAAGSPSIAGQWKIHNNIAGNESDQECTFTVADNKVTGSCTTDDKPVDITGSIDGNKVIWKYDSEYNGTPLTLTYTAMLGDMGKITGVVEVEPFGVSGEFSATPAKPAETPNK